MSKEEEIQKFHGCSYGYYDDDCYENYYSGYGGGYGCYGGYTTPPKQPIIATPKIEYTADELKKIKKQFGSENNIVAALKKKSAATEEFFKYVSYLGQEFEDVVDEYNDAESKASSERRYTTYFVEVNGKTKYAAEYYTSENGVPIYIARRIPLKKGDLVTGYNNTTKTKFVFNDGVYYTIGDLSEGDVFWEHGKEMRCERDGIYDLLLYVSFRNDSIHVRKTTGEYSKYELARAELKKTSQKLLKFSSDVTKLRDIVSKILDQGTEIAPENLSEAIRKWQCLERVVEFDIYEPYEVKVKKYGTSY